MQMKKPPESPEFDRFTAALNAVLKVSPTELDKRETAQKERGKRLSKGSACLSPAASELLRSSFSKS
jgi:hypothetical protein